MNSDLQVFQPSQVNFHLPDHLETGFLSNSYPCSFSLFGNSWLSIERCFHAQEASGDKPAAMIDRMRLCIAAKFLQSEALRLSLFNEKYDRAIFVNVSPTDSFWCTGGAGYGRNELGKLITAFRQEYRYSQTIEFTEIEPMAVQSIMSGRERFYINGKHYNVTNGYRSSVPVGGEFVMEMLLMAPQVVYRIRTA
jgi:predicted NAD-dependent protein-ADP-ribosyltransferase YbiA (DUF1768 family)